MSNSSLRDPTNVLQDVESASLGRTVLRPLKGAAFWAAIALPFLHLPLLITGVESSTTLIAFVTLLVLNVVALVVGHPYRDGE